MGARYGLQSLGGFRIVRRKSLIFHELGAIRRMRGLLKADQPALTDDEVTGMLDERRVEKYL